MFTSFNIRSSEKLDNDLVFDVDREGTHSLLLRGSANKSPWQRLGVPGCVPIPRHASTNQLPAGQFGGVRHDGGTFYHP